jgi:HSP20 family protein
LGAGKSFGTHPLKVPKAKPHRFAARGDHRYSSPAAIGMMEGNMITTFADPFDALFNLQRALEGRLASDWLHDQTTSQGPFPPINVFQQGDDILAIIELPGIEKDGLTVQAKENTIRIAGKKSVTFPDGVSVHRSERMSGEFDRTLSLPSFNLIRIG